MPASAKKRRRLDDAPPNASSSGQTKTQQSNQRPVWLPGIADPDESQGWSSEDPDSEEERGREGRRKSAWLAEYDNRVEALMSGGGQRPAPKEADVRRQGGTRIRDLKEFRPHSKLAVRFVNDDPSARQVSENAADIPANGAPSSRREIKMGQFVRLGPKITPATENAMSATAPAALTVPVRRTDDASSRSVQSDVIDLEVSSASVAGPSTPRASVAGKTGRGKKASKVVDYDKLPKKKKAEFSTVALFSALLADERGPDAQGSKSKRSSLVSKSTANLFAGCRVFYLLHPAAKGLLQEEDRLRMRRIAQSGGVLDATLELGATTHILTSVQRHSMGWDTSWKAIQAQLDSQGQKDAGTISRWKALLQRPTDGTTGEDVIWLIDPAWIVESLKANSDRPSPERYFRIESAASKRSTTGLSKAGSSRLAANSSVSLRQEPSEDFIGAKKDTFRERYGDEEGSTQNSAFHTSDYVSSTVSPALLPKEVSPERPVQARNGKPLRPLPTSSAAPGHKALRQERQRAADLSADLLNVGTSPDDIDIETSRLAETGEGEREKVPKAASSVYQELSREIELAKLGEGQEEELLLYNSDEGEPATDELDSDEETRKKPPAQPRKNKAKGGMYQCDRAGGGVSNKNGPNENVCKVMEKIVELYGQQPNDSFRIHNMRRAIGILRNSNEKLNEISTLTAYRGIGKKTAQKIVEIDRTGGYRRLAFATPEDKVRKLFTGIYGVGARTADKWYMMGLRTLDDVRDGKAGVQVTDGQKIGLLYYDDLQDRMPRAEAQAIFEHVEAAGKAIDSKLQLYIMGSFRRGSENCGDIDILITRDDSDGRTHVGKIKTLHQRLVESGLYTHTLSEPEDWDALDAKVMGLCKLPVHGQKQRRIDILGVPFDELGAALIYFTGNDIFNRSLRLKARHRGLSLNQRGLSRNVFRDRKRNNEKVTEGERIASRTEEEIFKILQVTWIPPERRNV